MTRSVRIAVGSVVCFVLVLVAAVSALVAVVASGQSDEDWSDGTGAVADGGFFVDPVEAEAEVLDVDGQGDGWVSLDVRFTTEDGDVEVGYVDLGEQGTSAVPQVGDTVDVVYERDQPQSVLRADDPMLTGEQPSDDPAAAPPQDRAAVAADLVRRVTTLALLSLVGAVLAAVVTVVAVRRAPAEAVLPENIQA